MRVLFPSMMDKLLREIDEFCTETGLSGYTVGWKSVKNGRLVERLRDGRRIWPENAKAVRKFMRQYRCKRNDAA